MYFHSNICYNRAGDDMKDIKMIVCDLDGTLLRDDKQISMANIHAIRECRKRGLLFGIASGRPIDPILTLMKEWGIQDDVDFVLGMNGGMYYDCHTKKKEEYYLLDGEIMKEIMDHFKGMDVRFFIFDGSTRYVNYSDEETRRKALLYHEIEVETDMYALCERPHNKLIIACDPSYMPVVEAHGKQYKNPACVCFKTAPDLFEYVDPRINKSFGVQKMCEHLGYSMKQVLAFGDTSNDVEMLRDAGIGVWMVNGTEDAKAVCDAVTCSNQEDGVACYLKEHIL